MSDKCNFSQSHYRMKTKGLIYVALYWFIKGAVTKYRLSGPTTEVYFLNILEAADPSQGAGMLGLS